MNVGDSGPPDFRTVYNEVFPVLFKVVFHIVRDSEAAEDICQETFIRFYSRKVPLPSHEESRYWLIRVAKNLAFNLRKKSEREQKAVERIKQEPETYEPGTEDGVLREETRSAVKEALDTLPVKYRTVLVLKEYGELNYREIAKILHISENNVKIRVYRARVLLEKALAMGDLHVF